MNDQNALELRGLTKRYPGFALEGVSFSLPAGSVMGLIGENGAGKTTTIRLILNLISPDGGEALIYGRDTRALSPEDRARIGVAFDECRFHDTLRARDVGSVLRLAYGARWDDAAFREYLRRFDLPADKMVKTYSRGMKAKLSLAAAMSHHPDLLILDEPAGGLDPVARDDLLAALQAFMQDERRAILLSSHITGDLEKICDYVTFLRGGRMAFSTDRDSLNDRYGVVRCDGELARRAASNALGARANRFGFELLVGDRSAFLRAYPGSTVDRASLEEIMLLYGKEL